MKIGYGSYDEFKFHWERAIPAETLVHYTLFFSVIALDVVLLLWAYADGWMGLAALFA